MPKLGVSSTSRSSMSFAPKHRRPLFQKVKLNEGRQLVGASDVSITVIESTKEITQPEELTNHSDKNIDLSPGELTRTDDPVRLYLREMGEVFLLTREGEIELAKRIEEGKYELSLSIAGVPMTLLALEALRSQLKKGDLRLRDLIVIQEPVEDEDLDDVVEETDEEDEPKMFRGL